MSHNQHPGITIPDEQTLQTWEDMRIEILHELQEGAIADVPDTQVDELGNLLVVLSTWRSERKPQLRAPLAVW